MKNKGITLISLIVTIIVLLILAGVTVSMLTGENGILSRAENAKEQSVIGEEKEQISLAWNEVKADKLGGEITAEELQEELDGKATVTEEDGKLKITFKKTGNAYSITGEGKIEETEGTTNNNIDLSQANITFTYEPDGSTNDSVTVTAKLNNEEILNGNEYKIQTTKNEPTIESNWEETDTQTLTENGEIYARIVSGTSVSSYAIGNVEKIDKTAPTIGEIVVNTEDVYSGTITISTIEDTGSGLAGIYISTSSTAPTTSTSGWINNISSSYTKAVESNGIYYVWVKDIAGNISEVKSCTVSGVKTVADDWQYTLSGSTITLTKYIGTSTEVTVNDTYTINGVTYNTVMKKTTYSSGTYAGPFVENSKITKVIFEDGVKYEENDSSNAFYNCSSLKTVSNLPNSIINMTSAFSGCTSLTTAPAIPSSVTNMQATFGSCTSLTIAPEIPSNVTDMTATFVQCTNLTTAPAIPSSVTNMQATFGGCSSLTTAPTIPASVTDMRSTFGGCSSLKTAPTIPASVTNMNNTFGACSSLTTAPTIPDSVTNMQETFAGCSSLITAPTIPNSVTNMHGTFNDCSSLTGTLTIKSSNVTDAYNIVERSYGFQHPTETSKFVTIVTPGSSSTTYKTIYNQNTDYVGKYFYLK